MNQIIRDVTVVPEGDGVDVKRLFPLPGFMNFDPFVLWDHFEIGPGHGFPDHQHRGFEGITYMFQGGMNHKDNLGNESFVKPGGAQRFTAGKGIVHSEMPANDGNSNGIQLWINLPKKLKQIEPSYQQVNDVEFPIEVIAGGTVKTIVGQVKTIVGEGSPIKLNTAVIYQHISLNQQAKYTLDVSPTMKGIIYLMEGELMLGSDKLTADQAVFIEGQNFIEIDATKNSEFMLCVGEPHNEPIVQHGPFVD